MSGVAALRPIPSSLEEHCVDDEANGDWSVAMRCHELLLASAAAASSAGATGPVSCLLRFFSHNPLNVIRFRLHTHRPHEAPPATLPSCTTTLQCGVHSVGILRCMFGLGQLDALLAQHARMRKVGLAIVASVTAPATISLHWPPFPATLTPPSSPVPLPAGGPSVRQQQDADRLAVQAAWRLCRWDDLDLLLRNGGWAASPCSGAPTDQTKGLSDLLGTFTDDADVSLGAAFLALAKKDPSAFWKATAQV